jgi:UDP-3-O-[3-hydroxymyristoyl] glucosamine N-acyltransferase
MISKKFPRREIKTVRVFWMHITVAELAALVGGELLTGDPHQSIHGFAALEDAQEGELSLFHDPRYRGQFKNTKASAVLVPVGTSDFPASSACIAVAEPSIAFESVLERLDPLLEPSGRWIHPTAVIAESVVFKDPGNIRVGPCVVIEEGATIGAGVSIGPGCTIGRNAAIGNGSFLAAQVAVYERCVIGDRVRIHSGAVIGADGFGYVFEAGKHRKIRQFGTVEIGDDVEIGAGTTIDRARIGKTRIGAGTKIDNLVQIGHNVVIGKHCILVAGVAIAGSARLGDYVVVAAQAGIAGHVQIGSRVTLGGRSGVTKDVPAGSSFLGFPAVSAAVERRRIASVNRLPRLLQRIKALEAQVAEISRNVR